MSRSPSPERTPHEVFIALAVMCFQFLAILHPEAIPFDSEELYNAAHARLIQLEHGARWLDLQYRGYCGGCTINAGIGAALFNIFGASLVTWKMVPILFIGVMTYFGAKALHQAVNLAAAVAWGALLCFAPPTFLELSMTAWGNHFESGVAAIVVLFTTLHFRRHPGPIQSWFVGVSLALSLWVGMSSAFLVLAVGMSIWGRITRNQFLTLTLGIIPIGWLWWLQWSTAPSSPFETIYYAGEQLPRLSRIPQKLWSLVAPRQLVALFGDGSNQIGWVLGWTSAALIALSSIATWRSRTLRPVIWFIVSYITVYSLVRFTVWAPPAPEIAPPGSMRYAAPIYGLAFFMLSACSGLYWAEKKRFLALAILAPSIAIGGQARVAQYEPPFPDKSVFSMLGPDFEYARDQLSYLIPVDEHKACPATDPFVVALHDFSIGWHETREILDATPTASATYPSRSTTAAMEGVSAALLSEIDPDEKGGIQALVHLHNRIKSFPTKAQITIHAEATWRRNWDAGLAEHGSTRVEKWFSQITSLPAPAQQGATLAFGRKWAQDLTRWRTPTNLKAPAISALNPSLQAAFVEGFGIGVGERWGPQTKPPQGLPEHLIEAWTVGSEMGMRKRWFKQTH